MWPEVTLADIFTIARGGSPRPIDTFITDDDSGINWIMIGDASEGSKYIESTKKKIRPEGASRSRMVYPGDFLLTNSMSFGKPYILKTSGCIHDGWLVLSPKSDQIHPDYFYYLLGSPLIYSEFKKLAAGAVVKNLNIELAKSLNVRLPPLDDQKRIAHLLGKVEGLIAKRKQHLQQLDALLKSVFLEMFGIDAFNHSGWPTDSLGAKADIVSGVTKGKRYADQIIREVPYMRVANVQDGRLDFSEVKTIEASEEEIERYQLQVGDLLLTEGGDPDKLGRGALWNDEIPGCIHQNHIFRVRITDHCIHPVFLSALIGSRYGKSFFQKSAKQTTGIASINSTQLKSFPLIIPPKSLQLRYAAIVEKVEHIKARYQQILADLEGLYGTLSQKAFAGELDLSQVSLPLIEEVIPAQMGLTKFWEEPSSGFVVPKIPRGTNLGDRVQREAMIGQWLEAYLKQLPTGQELSTADFIDAVNTAFQSEDDTPAWGLTDQDQLKNWIFASLENGEILQTSKTESDKRTLQKIVLKKARNTKTR